MGAFCNCHLVQGFYHSIFSFKDLLSNYIFCTLHKLKVKIIDFIVEINVHMLYSVFSIN